MELAEHGVWSDIKAPISTITLCRPSAGNALTPPGLTALHKSITAVGNVRDCRALVLRAEGAIFSQGLDLSSFVDSSGTPSFDIMRHYVRCLELLRDIDIPVIAVVAGKLFGGGLGFVAAADIALASDDASFSLPEVTIGMIPAMVTPFLLRRLTLAQIQYLTLSTQTLTAAQAHQAGLVDCIVTSKELEPELKRYLRRIRRSSPAAVAAAKRYFRQIEDLPFQSRLKVAEQALAIWFQGPEVYEGLRYFQSGSAPSWFAE